MLNIASTPKVKTKDGIVDMRELGNSKSNSSFRAYNNRLTSMTTVPAVIDMSSTTSKSSGESICETPTLKSEDIKECAAKGMAKRVMTCARTNLTGLLRKEKKRSPVEGGEKRK